MRLHRIVRSSEYESEYGCHGYHRLHWRVYTESDTIQIPEQIDGKPVRELADHAFADEPSVLYAESEKRRAVRSGDCWTFQSAGAGASAASTHFSGERTERPDASVNAAVPNSERRSTLPPALCGRRLRAVILPDALAAIGNYAFYGCDNLKTVSFPASICSIPALPSRCWSSDKPFQPLPLLHLLHLLCCRRCCGR